MDTRLTMKRGVSTILKEVAGLRGKRKIDFLQQFKDDKDLQQVVCWALDPYIVYPIRTDLVPPLKDDPDNVELQAMFDILQSMQLGFYSRREAETAVELLADEYPRVMPILHRILAKNLRCGVGLATARKVWGHLLPQWGVANLGTDIESLEFPFAAEYCYTGHRVIAVVSDGVVNFFNSKGRNLHRMPRLRVALENLSEWLVEDHVFDGVLVPKGASVPKAPTDNNAEYVIYDWVPTPDWKSRSLTAAFEDRYESLQEIMTIYTEEQPSTMLKKAKTVVVDKEQQLQDFYLDSLNHGYPGLVLKHLELPYDFNNNEAMVHWNPQKVFELPITEVVGGNEGVEEFKVDYNGYQVSVKYGFAPDEREDLWEKSHQMDDLRCRILAQESGSSLRFPRFLGVEGA